eukprot:5446956-Pyramimonas_sp.AAC.1
MVRPLLPGLSLTRYNRAGAGLRLRRSCWFCFPAPVKLGSGAGLWWSALALLFTSQCSIWCMVDYRHGGTSGCSGFARRN